MDSYKVKITAGGVTKWLGDAFEDSADKASQFTDRLGDFQKYVLNEAEYDEFHAGKTFPQLGLEKIEFIFD